MKFTNALIFNTDSRQFKPGELSVINGKIACETDGDTVDLGRKRIIPGMIDIHTHGRGGYESTAVEADGMTALARSYASIGTTSFMVTMMSTPLEQLEHCIDTAISAKNKDGANILGVYLEGRYISTAKRGAHDTQFIARPDPAELEALITRAKPLDIFYTICAPDVPGTEALVKRANELGAIVAIGHTDATYEECIECIGWGARSFTHIYNGMSGMHHREPGCLGAALASDAYTELICDGVHVAPAAVKVAYRSKQDKLILITDSAPAAGLPDGSYRMGNTDVIVRDGAVYLTSGTLIGGSISLFEAVKNLTRFAGITLEEAIPTATENPAKFLGVYDRFGSLNIGKSADFIVLDDNDEIADVYVRGQRIANPNSH